ncbi:MAG: hypothetical protein ACK4NC_04320 [Candidatus Gracilibacteria bacterium]
MKNYLKLSALYFLAFYVSASLFFFIATLLVTGNTQTCIFSTFQGSSSYHCMFPYQYIAALCLAAALVIPLWIKYFYQTNWVKKYGTLLLSFLLIIFISSIFGGILWATHEIIVVGDHRGMGWPLFYWFEIKNTLGYGWIVLARSFPYNLVILILGGIFINYSAKYALRSI